MNNSKTSIKRKTASEPKLCWATFCYELHLFKSHQKQRTFYSRFTLFSNQVHAIQPRLDSTHNNLNKYIFFIQNRLKICNLLTLFQYRTRVVKSSLSCDSKFSYIFECLLVSIRPFCFNYADRLSLL